MNEAPRRTLRELIARRGPGLCSDARRCEGLLRDLCGEHRREINILVGALRGRVPLDLLANRNSVPHGLLLTRLAKRLEDHLALTEEASRWAVDSWALALGVVTDAELEGIKGGREDTAATRAEANSAEARSAGAKTGPTPAPSRPPVEDRAEAHKAAGGSAAPTAPPPPRMPQAPKPAAARPSPALNPSSPRAPAPRATRGGPLAAGTQPTAAPHARPPAPLQTAGAGALQEPAADPARRGSRWRGCLVGCVVLLLLAALLATGAPLVINMLREEQLQRGPEPAPVQTR